MGGGGVLCVYVLVRECDVADEEEVREWFTTPATPAKCALLLTAIGVT